VARLAVTAEIRELGIDELPRVIGAIDRSEHVEREYQVVDSRLTERPVTFAEVPPWDPTSTGPFSVDSHVRFCRASMAHGGRLFTTLDGTTVHGAAVVEPHFEPPLAWLAFLHVSRPFRRQGVASGLWREAVRESVEASARQMYVSATPTGSAVGFYLSRGCVLADPPHPVLLAAEPDDIHFVLELSQAKMS
jgi:ribosomal protein S18 acetylase RimI-like enzyme